MDKDISNDINGKNKQTSSRIFILKASLSKWMFFMVGMMGCNGNRNNLKNILGSFVRRFSIKWSEQAFNYNRVYM